MFRVFHRARRSFSDFATSFAIVTVGTSCVAFAEKRDFDEIYMEEDVDITNWSNTHSIRVDKVFYPSTTIEVEKIVKWAHDNKQKLRPTGNGLSPNGNSFSRECMINLANCDRVIEIDTDRNTITVEGGATVTKILNALKEFNLTLENFSSIQEQQIAGWTQVAAHGTGAGLPTVEEQIESMVIVTPAFGRVELSEEKHPHLFSLAKAGLGSLGIVTELTLKCVPEFNLKERVFTTSLSSLRENHVKLLQTFRHVRYHYIPHTDVVVVAVCDPTNEKRHSLIETEEWREKSAFALLPFRELMLKWGLSDDEEKEKSFAEYRTALMEKDPLSLNRIKEINRCEAEFWKRSSGERAASSTDILGFECGSEQWVLEVAFKCGTRTDPDLSDLDFVRGLLKAIEETGVPAHAPIEQRWTSSSTALMSPAHSKNPDDLFSWVGIILYSPSTLTSAQRDQVTKRFEKYVNETLDPQVEKHNAHAHWSKLEVPKDEKRLEVVRSRVRSRFPVKEFNEARHELDPHGILSNDWICAVFDE